MLFLIQSLTIVALNLSILCASNDPFAIGSGLDEISVRNSTSVSELRSNIAEPQGVILSYTEKFFCRTASIVTAGITLYGLYYLSFERPELIN
ncbi:MAG: hypothetical protein KBD04_02695 [Proteobacteria bacterium]|nr:hypothetical protein [Pseudomonadota bacterium]